jgi:hypothetical protein
VNGPPNFDNIGISRHCRRGVDADVERNPYLAPYKRFQDKPLEEFVRHHQSADLAESDTALASGGIHNIPFVVKRATPRQMRSVFWIEEPRASESLIRRRHKGVLLQGFFKLQGGRALLSPTMAILRSRGGGIIPRRRRAR